MKLKFNWEFSWSHILSLIAVVFSVISLLVSYHQSKPWVAVDRQASIGGRFFDAKQQKWRFFGYDCVVLQNRGGRPVTLIGLRVPQSSPIPGMVSAYLKDGHAHEVKSEVLLIDNFFEDITRNPSIISDYKGWPWEKLSTLQRIIQPGGTEILRIGVLYDAYDGTEPIADYILTELEFYYSDGTVQPYRNASQIPKVH